MRWEAHLTLVTGQIMQDTLPVQNPTLPVMPWILFPREELTVTREEVQINACLFAYSPPPPPLPP